MKYLKLFEQISLYSKIDILEFNKKVFGQDDSSFLLKAATTFIKDNWCSFDEKEISDIKSISKSLKTDTWPSWPIPTLIIGLDNTYQDDYLGPKRIEVYKLKDEWYYLDMLNNYYKCDQFDGLINCIKYLLK